MLIAETIQKLQLEKCDAILILPDVIRFWTALVEDLPVGYSKYLAYPIASALYTVGPLSNNRIRQAGFSFWVHLVKF